MNFDWFKLNNPKNSQNRWVKSGSRKEKKDISAECCENETIPMVLEMLKRDGKEADIL